MTTKATFPAFCYITPTAYLEQYAAQSRSHLVLAHLVHSDPEYTAFYKQRSELGDFLMMDNSAYEFKEAWNPELLVELAHKCGAHAIVLPDYPFQEAQVTIDAAKKYIPLFKQNGFKTFFVPQSKTGDISDWMRAYEYASNHPDIDIIGMSILGIPNALPAIDPAYARVVMSQLLISMGIFNHSKHHHYLGLNSGPGLEIPSLLRLNALSTIDSSGPTWHAILGHEYSENTDSLQAVRKCNMPVIFDIKMSKDKETLRRIQHNINLTQKLFTNSNQQRTWYAQE